MESLSNCLRRQRENGKRRRKRGKMCFIFQQFSRNIRKCLSEKGHQLLSSRLKSSGYFKLYVHQPWRGPFPCHPSILALHSLPVSVRAKSPGVQQYVLEAPEEQQQVKSEGRREIQALNKQFIRPFRAILSSQLGAKQKLLIRMAESIFISFVASARFWAETFLARKRINKPVKS